MDIISEWAGAFGDLPAAVALAGAPALLALGAAMFTIFGGRGKYPAFACAAGGVAVFLLCGTMASAAVLAWAGLYVALAALLSLLFLLPRVPRKKRESREERIYRKFHEELHAAPPPAETRPPKVCCFEETPAPAEGNGLRLSHVRELIDRLKSEKLAPADRLELDVLSHEVDGCRGKPLTKEETGALNDCLAAVLKMTAKYRL